MPDMGYSYQPGMAGGPNGQPGQGARATTPQEALRVLSFRVPKRAPSFAPSALLPGGGGPTPDAAALNTIVSALMQAVQPSNQPRRRPSAPSPVDSDPMGGNVSFTPGGGGGAVTNFVNRAPTPTFTPGDTERGGSVQDLFGNDVARDESGGGGTKQEVNGDGGYGDWLQNERYNLNGLGIDWRDSDPMRG